MADYFVTVGTHPQQFDRLLAELDRLVESKKIKGSVFAQIGHSNYEPKNFPSKRFLALNEFEGQIAKAKVIITHAGEGNIGLAKNMGKKMVVVPRMKAFGEHTNDHQLELAEIVEKKSLGLVAWNPEEVGGKILALKSFSAASVPRGNIGNILEGFVKREFS
ncbi:MAG: beta(1,3)galactosyltransferase EpsH [archaeon]|nr:beta(1,3)galactosyltransferase EpsH [archaeon]